MFHVYLLSTCGDARTHLLTETFPTVVNAAARRSFLQCPAVGQSVWTREGKRRAVKTSQDLHSAILRKTGRHQRSDASIKTQVMTRISELPLWICEYSWLLLALGFVFFWDAFTLETTLKLLSVLSSLMLTQSVVSSVCDWMALVVLFPKRATKVAQRDTTFARTSHQNKGAEVLPEVGLSVPGHGPGSVVGDSMLVLFSVSSRGCYGRNIWSCLPVTRVSGWPTLPSNSSATVYQDVAQREGYHVFMCIYIFEPFADILCAIC